MSVLSWWVPVAMTAALAAPTQAVADTVPDEVADEVIGLSPDGAGYADTLEAPLFPGTVRWVPGDRRTASWWVRNQAAEAAELAVGISEDATLPGWLSVQARSGGPWRPLRTDPAVLAAVMAPGESRRVVVRVRMVPKAGNPTMRSSADLRLRIRLTGASGTGPGGTGPGGTGAGAVVTGALPDTGLGLGPGILVLGTALVAAGAAVLRRRRGLR